MRVGSLRHRIKLQPDTLVQDSSGHEVTVWDGNNEIDVSSSIRSLRAEELMQARKIESSVAVTIVIRNSSQVASVDHTWRALHGTTAYAIHGIMPLDDKQRWLQLFCSEGVQDQGTTVYGAALYDVDDNILEFVGGDDWETVD